MSFFLGVKQGAHLFGENIALIVNTTLLFVVYIIGVGLTSIVAKIFRKHFLDTRLGKRTYWKDLNLKKRPIEEHLRQF